MTVADRIRDRREELNMTQDELAAKMGLSSGRSNICKLEASGDHISLKKIAKVGEALGVSTAYLMGWEPIDYEKTFNEVVSPQDTDEVKQFKEDYPNGYLVTTSSGDIQVEITSKTKISEAEFELIKRYRAASKALKQAVDKLLQ